MFAFSPLLRPPGAAAENEFLKQCVRCGKCVTACPHESVKLAGGWGAHRGTPYIDPHRTPCRLCMKCPPVCPTNALDGAVASMEQVKMGQAYIRKDLCHNHTDGTMCSTCFDRCPLRGTAVIMEYGITPAMTTACAGCGICAYVCPVDAVEIVPAASRQIPENSLPLLPPPGTNS